MTQATLPWIILFTVILIGSAGGLAFLAVTVRDSWREWRDSVWEDRMSGDVDVLTAHAMAFVEASERAPGNDGVWFTDMLKESDDE